MPTEAEWAGGTALSQPECSNGTLKDGVYTQREQANIRRVTGCSLVCLGEHKQYSVVVRIIVLSKRWKNAFFHLLNK